MGEIKEIYKYLKSRAIQVGLFILYGYRKTILPL